MRVLLRVNIDQTGAETVMDTTFTYSSAQKTREHYTALKAAINSLVSTEMEAIFNNPSHNYLDVLISRRTV